MYPALISLPLLMAGLTLVLPSRRGRTLLLPVSGAAHFALAWRAVGARSEEASTWLALDAPGKVVLLLVSFLFLTCSLYAVGYMAYRRERPDRVFCACFQVLLSMMSLVVLSNHLGLMWVAMEAATLSTAPLIYYNRTPRSIEATWKYLLVGSVGIAIALLGSLFLAYASLHANAEPSLVLTDLRRVAPNLSAPWTQAAFMLILVGYGTKMGLAPMHTWKPDAYGEAPGIVGAMLAGGLTSCAFLAIVRVFRIVSLAGEGELASRTLVAMGLFSMALAGMFMAGQRDFKRMLAYSSVEHMGILVLGLGLGGLATFGAFLHMVYNGITKCVLFLSAGNIHRSFDSKTVDGVSGAIRRLPASGTLFLFGFLAITGSPPFAVFFSEFTILRGALEGERFVVAGLFLLFLFVVFVAMGATVLAVVQGRPDASLPATRYRDGLLTVAPVAACLLLLLVFGFHLPAALESLLSSAARSLVEGP